MSARRMAMSGADAAWLHMGRRENPMVINALVQLSEALRIEDLRELLQRRLLSAYPKFTMTVEHRGLGPVGSLGLGEAAWVADPDFDLDRHVHHIALPQPADAAALRSLLSDLASTPLPMEMPPWQAHLIERGGSDTALVVRMHHCIADGIALARVLLSLTDAQPDSEEPRERREAPAADGLGLETLLHPQQLLRLALEGARDVEVLARLTLARPDPHDGLKGALSGLRRVGWCEPIGLDRVKAIAHRHRATVNDVLLAAVAGALRAYLKRAGERAPRMRAIVPFNLREPDEPPAQELGNHFGLVFVDLPLSERGRRQRLAKVKAGMDEIKRSPEGPVSYAVLQAMGALPQPLQSGVVELFTSKGSAVVTNVPGPRRQRLLAGAGVASLQIWAPTSGSVALSVSIISYNGGVTVGLMADPAVVEDPQRIAEEVAAEVAAMERLRPAPDARRAA